jgi:hypothetical protein
MDEEVTSAATVLVALLNQRLDQFERKLDKALDDHEARLRRLEAWSYGIPIAGLISIGSVIAAAIAATRA